MKKKTSFEKITIEIIPESHVRSTKGDVWLFRFPVYKLTKKQLDRKKRLEQYIKYKENLLVFAKKLKLEYPKAGMFIKFYFPLTPGWSGKKKARLVNTGHQQKPDWDNLAKAFQDALVKKDQEIFDIGVSKHWSEKGKIEIYLFKQPLHEILGI